MVDLFKEFLSEWDWTNKLVPDLIIYFGSFFCFAFIPASFGKKVWLVLAWFVGVNAVFLLDLGNVVEWRNPMIFLTLGQAPWILVVLDLLFKGKLSSKVAAIPLRSIILWQTTRIMSVHFVFTIFGGLAPATFSAPVALSEIITGLGAVVLYFKFNAESSNYRMVLLFWNTYGLTSMLSAEYRIFFANPQLRFFRGDADVITYLTSYPQAWCYCFWFPLAIGMHAALYYKLYITRPQGLRKKI